MSIAIVMATYNGGLWLRAQLDSLFAQTVRDWHMLIRDDGSADDTLSIAREYQLRYPGCIHIVDNPCPRSGAAKNFAALLGMADADYILCCDQDDVWKSDKIAVSLAAMRSLEQRHGNNTPLLVHTDATLTDQTLTPTCNSFAAHLHSAPGCSAFSRILVQNAVHGCTLMANRALLKIAMPMPAEARMHDMWLALVASAFGHIVYVPEQTLYYRQHGTNDIGARKPQAANAKAVIRKTMQENIAQHKYLPNVSQPNCHRRDFIRSTALSLYPRKDSSLEELHWCATACCVGRYGRISRCWLIYKPLAV